MVIAYIEQSVLHVYVLLYLYTVILSEITDLSDENSNTVNFTCIANGQPAPSIYWHFNDVMISHSNSNYMIVSESINLTTISTLTIFNAISSDVGVYTCNATNTLGSDVTHG